MKRYFAMFFVAVVFVISGCGQQPRAQNSDEAIQQAEQMQDAGQKIDYLTAEAEAFLESEEYQDALATAQYVLFRLDQDSQRARDVVESAKARMKEATEQQMEKMQGDLENQIDRIGQ